MKRLDYPKVFAWTVLWLTLAFASYNAVHSSFEDWKPLLVLLVFCVAFLLPLACLVFLVTQTKESK